MWTKRQSKALHEREQAKKRRILPGEAEEKLNDGGNSVEIDEKREEGEQSGEELSKIESVLS